MSIINTALSGLQASSRVLDTSANNIANINSTQTNRNGVVENKPYTPQQVVQTSQQTGGVATSLRDITPPSIPVFNPDDIAANDDGIVQTPNVSLEQELIQQRQAVNTYKANASAIRRENEMYQSTLDIIS